MFHKIIIFYITLYSSNVWTSETIKKLDLNKDGIIDRIEYYKQNKLIKLEEDRNNDGHIDNIYHYNLNDYIQVWEQDTDYNKIIDRKVSDKYNKGKVEIKYEKDKDQDGIYETIYFQVIHSDQKINNCYSLNLQKQLDVFAEESLKMSAASTKGFLLTNFGYSIDLACIKQWGVGFPWLVKNTINEGLQCIIDLDKKKGNKYTISGALKNSHELLILLENENVKLVCSEKEYEWEGTLGHASTTSKDKLTNPPAKMTNPIEHPFISLLPRDGKSKALELEKDQLKNTIFHEQLHNLGFKHEDSIEYPYACSDCCFGNDIYNPAGKYNTVACKICLGEYKNETDINYLHDILKYANKNSYFYPHAKATAIKSLKESPKDLYILSLFVKMGNYDVVSTELAQLIQRNHKNLSSKIQNNINEAAKVPNVRGRFSGKIISEVYYQLYFNHDADAAVKLLEDNKDQIRNEILTIKNNNDSFSFVAKNLSSHLDKIIYDLWVNKYGNKDGENNTFMRAYRLIGDLYELTSK